MSEFTATRALVRAAAGSHPGLQRPNNEDRCHADSDRGIFFVIDGVGGHAAGDKAADIALAMLRARLERETGSVAERVREAITLANNEIYRASQADPALAGMACVLTIAIVRDGHATVGHVGDSRLYKLRGGSIRKITRDHSPVGDREDRGEISELEAMHHPRRNEIYRDVGSEAHNPDDEGFVDLVEIDFEPDSALLLCTDGLSDLVSSARMSEIATRAAGNPALVVERLVEAAIDAGGKDNVSVVFVEGERFAAHSGGGRAGTGTRGNAATDGRPGGAGAIEALAESRWVALAAGLVLGAALVLAALTWVPPAAMFVRDLLPPGAWPRVWVVSQDGRGDFTSIRDALARARAGDTVRVEPGEYAERVVLTGPVALVSSDLHAAIIVPDPAAPLGSAAVEVQGQGARFSGLRIAGDERRQLGVGIRFRGAGGQAEGLEITGARVAAVEVEGRAEPVLKSAYLHDNPGVAVLVGAGANPNLSHNVITNNGRSPESPRPAIELRGTARPVFFGNIVMNNGIDEIRGLAPATRDEVMRDNIVGHPAPAVSRPPAATRKPGARRQHP